MSKKKRIFYSDEYKIKFRFELKDVRFFKFLTILLLFFLFIIFFSCKESVHKVEESSKFREKNITEIIYLESVSGKIDIKCWNRDYIEIEANKIVKSGIKADLNSLDLIYKRENLQFTIITKNPSRVEGDIDLKLYIPYYIKTIIIKADHGKVKIGSYPGNLIANISYGSIKYKFNGSLMRITSLYAKLDLQIDTMNPADIYVLNENGKSYINVVNVGKGSYFDFNSRVGKLELSLAKYIDYNIFTKFKNNNSEVKLSGKIDMIKKRYNNLISAEKGKNYQDFNIYINNDNGILIIDELKM